MSTWGAAIDMDKDDLFVHHESFIGCNTIQGLPGLYRWSADADFYGSGFINGAFAGSAGDADYVKLYWRHPPTLTGPAPFQCEENPGGCSAGGPEGCPNDPIQYDIQLVSPDFDDDGEVTLSDLSMFSAAWSACTNSNDCDPDFDLNQDGTISLADFSMFGAHYYHACGN